MASDGGTQKGPIARFFGSLTNALLDVGLPAIRAWLRDRVGAAADIAQVTKDGSFIHLDGVRIPVGPRGSVVLERATAKMVSPTKIRIHAFHGGIAFGHEKEASFVAGIRFTSSADADDAAWVNGDLEIDRASWTNAGGRANPPMSGRARLFVSESVWRLEDGELRGDQAVARFSGTGSLDANVPVAVATMELEKCRVGPFVDAASSIGGRPLAVPAGVPLDALLEGRLAWDATRGGDCDLCVSAEAGSLSVVANVTPDGKTIHGRVEGAVMPHVPLRAAGLERWAPRAEDAITFAVDVAGETTRPTAKGAFRADALGFRLGRPRYVPPTMLGAVEGSIETAGGALRLHVTAKAGKGTIAADVAGRAREIASLRGTARLLDVDGKWIEGVLSGLGRGFPLPADLRLSVDAALEEGFSVVGRGRIATPRSDIAIDPLVVRGGDAAGTRAKGTLSADDLLSTGLLDFSVRPDPLGALDLDLTASAGNVLHATARIPEIRLRFVPRPELGPFVLSSVEGRLSLSRTAFAYDDVRFDAYGGSFVLAGTIPFDGDPSVPRLRVHATGADGSLVRAAASFAAIDPPLPRDLRVDGDLDLDGAGRITSRLSFGTGAGSALTLALRLSEDARLDGSRIEGDVELSEVALLAKVDLDLRGRAHVELDLGGPSEDPVLAGFVASERLEVSTFVVHDVSVLVHADARRLAWNRLEATAYDGTLRACGIVGYGRAFSDLIASIAAEGVTLEEIEGAKGVVAGKLSGHVDLARKRSLRGRGALRITAPEYPVLERARASLRRFGLAPPPSKGIGPATALLEITEGGVRFHDVHAAVPGCSAAGDAIVSFTGELRAVATVIVDEEYLASSAMLVVPKVLTDRLTLPIRISGPLRTPNVDADLAACFGRFLRENRVSALVGDAVEEVALFLGKDVSREERPSPAPPREEDHEDVERLNRMLGTAADWDVLDERRRGGSRVRVS